MTAPVAQAQNLRAMPDTPVVTKASPWSVDDTVARLSAVIAARGMKEFALIDYSGEADNAGLDLPNTKLAMFGRPEAGTHVIAASRLAALDLPLKVLVWADDDSTKVSYTPPAALARRYGLSQQLTGLLAEIDALTDVVIAM
jgi:uncharacterized protein (DUF302 family)